MGEQANTLRDVAKRVEQLERALGNARSLLKGCMVSCQQCGLNICGWGCLWTPDCIPFCDLTCRTLFEQEQAPADEPGGYEPPPEDGS